MAPFSGSPLRVQTGAELKGFHTCRAKDSGRSSSCCVPGCRMPVAEDPAFLLPCCLFDPFTSPFGDPKSPLLCQPTQRVQRHQDEGHNHLLVSREAFLSQLGRHLLGCPIEKSEAGVASHPPPSAGHSYTVPRCLDLAFYWECWH